MINECPSCKMNWEDDCEPITQMNFPVCIFCKGSHTNKELLNWQMNQIENIPPKYFPLVLRNFYRYVESEINNIKEIDNEYKKTI